MANPNQNEGRQKNAAVPDHNALERNAGGGQAGKEPSSFKKDGQIPNSGDLLGPAGDPVEGKRKG